MKTDSILRTRCTIATLLCLVTICALGFALLSIRIIAANAQKAAVSALQAEGNEIWYKYQLDKLVEAEPLIRNGELNITDVYEDTEPNGLPILRSVFGIDFTNDVAQIIMFNCKGRQDIVDLLNHIAACPENRFLTVAGCEYLRSGDLKFLRDFRKLERLSLLETSVGNDIINYIPNNAALTYLDVSQTQVDRDGVQRLQVAFPNAEIVASHLRDK